MKHIIRQLPLFLLCLCGIPSGKAQTYLLQEDFEGSFPPAGWSIHTPPGNYADGWTYGPQPGLLSGVCVPQGSKTMVTQWATYYPNNTWAFTPGLSLTAGTTYTLGFKQCVQSPSSNKTESLKITVGNQANPASQTLTLSDLPTLTNTSSANRNTTFTPSASGVYYFGFHAYSAANQRYLSIDSVSVYTDASAPVFPAPYCSNTFPSGTEPITRVTFAGIDNITSAALNTPAHEDYTAQTATVIRGQSHPVSIKGNTNGANYSYIKVYIDWNQNNVFTDAGEEYALGTLYNSNGTDATAITNSISVPADAGLGTTRMRVIKKDAAYAATACNTDGKGQTEEYSVEVRGITSVEVHTENNVPAYITGNGGTLQLVSVVYPLSMSQAVTWSIVPGSGAALIDNAGLVTAQSNGNVWAKAVSVTDPSKKDSLQITIINQTVAPTGISVSTQGNVPAEITTANGSLALVATITPADAGQSVLWSIVPVSGNASINSAGIVTPLHNGTVWAKARAAVQPALQDSLLISITIPGNTAGIDKNEVLSVEYYPNPTSGLLSVFVPDNHPECTLTLTDVNGKTVWQYQILANRLQTPLTLDVSPLKNGLYFLHLSGASFHLTQKIVKDTN